MVAGGIVFRTPNRPRQRRCDSCYASVSAGLHLAILVLRHVLDDCDFVRRQVIEGVDSLVEVGFEADDLGGQPLGTPMNPCMRSASAQKLISPGQERKRPAPPTWTCWKNVGSDSGEKNPLISMTG